MAATTHKIGTTRSGTTNGMDWDADYEITFLYRPGRPAKMYLRNGDPGYPEDPPEVEFVSVSPDAGDHGAFTDLAQQGLEDWASDWLQGDGFDLAIEKACADLDAEQERARDMGLTVRS